MSIIMALIFSLDASVNCDIILNIQVDQGIMDDYAEFYTFNEDVAK